jgi:hypothetical protein
MFVKCVCNVMWFAVCLVCLQLMSCALVHVLPCNAVWCDVRLCYPAEWCVLWIDGCRQAVYMWWKKWCPAWYYLYCSAGFALTHSTSNSWLICDVMQLAFWNVSCVRCLDLLVALIDAVTLYIYVLYSHCMIINSCWVLYGIAAIGGTKSNKDMHDKCWGSSHRCWCIVLCFAVLCFAVCAVLLEYAMRRCD